MDNTLGVVGINFDCIRCDLFQRVLPGYGLFINDVAFGEKGELSEVVTGRELKFATNRRSLS